MDYTHTLVCALHHIRAMLFRAVQVALRTSNVQHQIKGFVLMSDNSSSELRHQRDYSCLYL